MEEFFIQNDVNCLEKVNIAFQDELEMYMKIFVLLYADDTILLSESEEGLKNILSAFETYCTVWKLSVNFNKTKIVIFSKRKPKTTYEFKMLG